MRGLVIRNTGSWYDVRTDDGQLFACKVKGNFRLRGIRSTNPVAVGDMVEILEEKRIPWAHVYGNHDAEGDNVPKEKQQQIYESFDYCVSQAGDPSLPGVGNYVLPVSFR